MQSSEYAGKSYLCFCRKIFILKDIFQINDERDGTYIIAFTPDAAGKLAMTVKIQDKDIKVQIYYQRSLLMI